jgi:AcrR family transcriptional regulator
MAEALELDQASLPEAEATDPRIRRTRDLLQQALHKLLDSKDFDKISVQDITDAATVNRATFYAHYPDKFALLECLVASDFNSLLSQRGVRFDGGCSSALRGLVLGICDFLAKAPGTACERQRQLEPHMEAAVVAVVRTMLLAGLKKHAAATIVSPEMQAATMSWAMYGAAKEWVRTPNRPPSEEMAETVVQFVAPLMHPAALLANA